MSDEFDAVEATLTDARNGHLGTDGIRLAAEVDRLNAVIVRQGKALAAAMFEADQLRQAASVGDDLGEESW